MLPAVRSPRFLRWFSKQTSRRLRSQFGSLEVAGLSHLIRTASEHPVVVVANHSSWWDGIMVLELSIRRAQLETYAMMDGENLSKLAFFRLLGAFGFDRTNVRERARAIRYGASLLRRGTVLWVFPQGEERPTHEPLTFLPGAGRIASLAKAKVVPAALSYGFGSDPRPRAFASFGPPLDPQHLQNPHPHALQASAVAVELERIAAHRSARPRAGASPDFELLFADEVGAIERWSTRLLDRLARFWIGYAHRRLGGDGGSTVKALIQQSARTQTQSVLSPADLAAKKRDRERTE